MTDEFKAIIYGLFEVYNQDVSKLKVNVYWSIIGSYPMLDLKKAANLWVRKSQFMPKPADLLKLISVDKYISADEAWSTAIQSIDENNTVVWTSETQKAWRIAEPVYSIGDKIGARRTFIDTYDRLVDESMMNGTKTEYLISLGQDKSRRKETINRAVTIGYISQDKANHYLPKPENNVMMLENKNKKTASGVPDSVKELIAKFRQMERC